MTTRAGGVRTLRPECATRAPDVRRGSEGALCWTSGSPSLAAAVAGVRDGATVLIGGFGNSGVPVELTHALLDQGARDLTVVTNNAGSGETDVAALLRERRVRKIVCSYPRSAGSIWFEQLYRAARSSWNWCRRAR